MTTITGVKYAFVSAAGGETVKTGAGSTLATLATGDVVVVLTVSDQAPQANSQQQTVGQRSPLNVNWPRSVRAGNTAVSIGRYGAKSVQWLTAVIAEVSVLLEPSITWTPPTILGKPSNQTGAFFAQGILTATALPTNADTVTINSIVYHFVSTIGVTAGNVLIDAGGATLAAKLANTLANLAACINAGTGGGSLYIATATSPNASVTAATTGTTVQVTAKANGTGGNAFGTTVSSTGAIMAWGHATLLGGAAATEVPFVASFGSELTLSFLWQVSADGGATWSTVSDGGIYDIDTDATGLISTLAVTPADTSAGSTDRSSNIGLTGNLYRCTATDSATVPGSITTSAAVLVVT